MPANHGLWANEVERLAPPSPPLGEPHPEGSIDAPELRSLRSAMEQGELLPEGQVLEREVGAGSERRAQGAQRSDHEEHCRHGSHAAVSSSSLGTGFWQTTSVRRELLDQVVVFNERHLRRLLNEYVAYYHDDRTHDALAKETRRPSPCSTPGSMQHCCVAAAARRPASPIRGGRVEE